MFDIKTTARLIGNVPHNDLYSLRASSGMPKLLFQKIALHAKNKERRGIKHTRRIELRLPTLSSFYYSIRIILFLGRDIQFRCSI